MKACHWVPALAALLALGSAAGGARAIAEEEVPEPSLGDLGPGAGPAGPLRQVEVRRDGGGVEGLAAATELAVSPDGRHLYVTGFHLAGDGGSAVVVFERDPTNGKTTFVEVQRDSFGPVDGLAGARGVAVSPDGAHVYVAGYEDNALVTFARNRTTGQLDFVDARRDGVDGDGLWGVTALVVSPDGRQVYATGGVEGSLVVFTRDPTSGRLSFLEKQSDGVDLICGLSGAQGLAISPDGGHVYVAGTDGNGVVVFARDATTGGLRLVEWLRNGVAGLRGLLGAWGIAVSPDGDHVYVSGRWHDSLVVFARDPASGRLTFVERQRDGVGGVDGLGTPGRLAVSPDGSRVYVTGLRKETVAVFARRAANGRLLFEQVLHDGVGGVDGLLGAEGVAVSPDSLHVYVASALDSALAAFTAAPRAQRLGIAGPAAGVVGQALSFTASAADCSPADVWAWAADGGTITSTGRTSSITWSSAGPKTVTVRNGGCPRAGATAAVRVREGPFQTLTIARLGTGAAAGRVRSGPPGIDCGGGGACEARYPEGARIRLNATPSPGGTLSWGPGCRGGRVVLAAHVTCEVTFGAVPLDLVEVQRDGVDGIDWPSPGSAVAASPDGAHVYAASLYEPGLAVFARDVATGALRFVAIENQAAAGVVDLSRIVPSPDGAHLYVLGFLGLGVFARDPASGRLTLVQVHRGGVGGVLGLDGAVDLVVSADGRHVYVAGRYEGALAIFARDLTSGRLTFLEALRQGIDGVEGLADPSGIAISPDGAHVYLTSIVGSSLAVFARDPVTGRLAFVEVLRVADGVVDLFFAWRVAVSPEGAQVYVTTYAEGRLVVFARDPSTGRLTFVAAERDGVDGVDGLDRPDGIAISPDGSRLYVSGRGDSALAVFDRELETGELDYLGAHRDGIGGIDGLRAASALAVSPDGRHVYVTAGNEEALSVFAVRLGP